MKSKIFIFFIVCILIVGCKNRTSTDISSDFVESVDELKVAEIYDDEDEYEAESESVLFVDLGLPSGTKWAAEDTYGFYTYEEAYYGGGNQLPTKEQCEELVSECQWRWKTVINGMSTAGSGYEVIGPNGNSIFLKANGYVSSGCAGYNAMEYVSDIGEIGAFHSSTPYSSDYSWGIHIYPNSYEVKTHSREAMYSIHLVQN